jgi:hypothetical protein
MTVGVNVKLVITNVELLLLPPPQADHIAVKKKIAAKPAREADENRRMYPPRTIFD